MSKPKMTLDSLWGKHVEVSRIMASRLSGGLIPRCGYEVVVARRIHEGHQQTLYLQNISNDVYRFWTYTDVCAYRGEPIL